MSSARHSNVQGIGPWGITPKVDPAFLGRMEQRYQFVGPKHRGSIRWGPSKRWPRDRFACLSLGGNFLSANPDTEFTAMALGRCKLSVHISTKLHRGHLCQAVRHLSCRVLVAPNRMNKKSGPQFVTVENSMSVVHRTQGS